MYDFIGDIHGHADELRQLLVKLEYEQHDETWSHQQRKVIFLGDYIDRGPKQKETIDIVRGMVEAGNAIALMGNHELNAIGFSIATADGKGFLRPHSSKNREQHQKFLDEFPFGSSKYKEVIAWFKTLPMCFETTDFRAIHACYDTRQLKVISDHLGEEYLINDKFLVEAFTVGSQLYEAIEVCLKGIELDLPAGMSFLDKDGIERHNVRCKWWDPQLKTFKEVAIISDENIRVNLCDKELPANAIAEYDDLKPVFFGHYWHRGETPQKLSDFAACLDYSVASKDLTIGKLAAYRMGNESRLDNDHFVYVDSMYAKSN